MRNVTCDNDKCKFNNQGDCDAEELVLFPHQGHTICTTVEEREGE